MSPNDIYDSVICQIQLHLDQLSPDLGKVSETQVILRFSPQNPLVILADEESREWLYHTRWNSPSNRLPELRVFLSEILATTLGSDLGLRVIKYYPYLHTSISPLDNKPYLRWGSISRYDLSYKRFEHTPSEHRARCIEQYLADIVHVLVFSWWVNDTDDSKTNWLCSVHDYSPLRIDWANSTFNLMGAPHRADVQILMAQMGIYRRRSGDIKRAYDDIVDRIHCVPLHEYFSTPVFSVYTDERVFGSNDFVLLLEQSRERLRSESVFEEFTSYMCTDKYTPRQLRASQFRRY